MKKYNIWNKRELNKNVADYKLQQGLVNRKGFRNPDKYGMFRTKDINLMTDMLCCL